MAAELDQEGFDYFAARSDSAPADALVLARQADATLAVVRWESTSRSAVSDAVRLLRGSGAFHTIT